MTQPAAIITGSSRGIGRAIALELASAGYSVTVNYLRHADAAQAAVADILAQGVRAIAVQGDVGVESDRQRMLVETVEEFGRLDMLVNNAGITSPGRKDLLEATTESWDAVFDTNLKGPFFLAQQAALTMIEQIRQAAIPSGLIVNISSISAHTVSTNRADYCIAKAAMQMMTWLLADRLATEQIRVFEICPGVIASDMTAPVKEKYDKLIAEGLTPIRRWGEPADVAKVARALTTAASAFSTGARLKVHGGLPLRRL